MEAAGGFQAQVKDAIRQFRNAIEDHLTTDVARKRAKGGSCRAVFQSLAKDAIRHFRSAMQTPFGNRRCQERAKCGSWGGLGDRHGQECGKSRCGKDGSCKGFSGSGERCHPAVSKPHRAPFDDRRGQEKAKGGSCRAVFQSLAKDAIRHFRSAMQTPFGNRRCQERAKCGSWRGLGDRHGQECGKSRCGKDGSCRQQTWLPTGVARPQPMSHTCGDPRRRPGYAIFDLSYHVAICFCIVFFIFDFMNLFSQRLIHHI